MSNTEEILAVDIGGTNARFCRARVSANAPPVLSDIRKYKVADHASLAHAWRHFAEQDGGDLPDRAVIALAAPIGRTPVKLTNSDWVVDAAELSREVGLRHLRLVNDFEAIAYGVTMLPANRLRHLFGPERGLPEEGVITVLGPGTGLGVGIITRARDRTNILATEGGHMDFAPVDQTDDRLLAQLRAQFGRVSVERVVSGPGLSLIYGALCTIADRDLLNLDDGALWQAALSRDDACAAQALTRLCMSYGSVAGDLALAHGAKCVVLAGSLTQRMRESRYFEDFHIRFLMKGRYRDYMAGIPILYADHPEFGLFGAAVAGSALTDL